jgi:hypothetical protein
MNVRLNQSMEFVFEYQRQSKQLKKHYDRLKSFAIKNLTEKVGKIGCVNNVWVLLTGIKLLDKNRMRIFYATGTNEPYTHEEKNFVVYANPKTKRKNYMAYHDNCSLAEINRMENERLMEKDD